MAFAGGKPSVTLEELLNKVSEFDVLNHYFGVSELPVIINSPLRQDRKPSFGLYSSDGRRVHFVDYATRDRGGLWDLLGLYWGVSYIQVLTRVWEDLPNFSSTNPVFNVKTTEYSDKVLHKQPKSIDLKCKVRPWAKHDIEFWESFGITLEWLDYADIYPISHKIVIKNGQEYVFGADKYAYAYVERKEGNITLKIYQPFNTKGYKWSNRHDRSVISLWTKVPEFGTRICICASMKDALCLWANTGIPAIAIQGEGYGMSETAVSELRRRYREVYILLDNDEAGLKDGEKLSESTGFTNLILPNINGAKDVADLYKQLQNKELFKEIILGLFK
jgi:hypothetical protein